MSQHVNHFLRADSVTAYTYARILIIRCQECVGVTCCSAQSFAKGGIDDVNLAFTGEVLLCAPGRKRREKEERERKRERRKSREGREIERRETERQRDREFNFDYNITHYTHI